MKVTHDNKSGKNNHIKQLFFIKATSSQPVCAAVTPVETTASCDLSYVRTTDKTRNTAGAAV